MYCFIQSESIIRWPLLSHSFLAVSLSQQNSPRRSLIPQPTYRQRSTSLTKDSERSPSPKIGRRVDSRTRLNVSDSRRLNAADSKSRLNDSKTRLNKFDSRSRTNLSEKARFISNSTSKLNGNSVTATRRQSMTKGSTTRLSPIQGTPTKPEKTTPRSNMKGKDATRQSPTKTSKTSPQKNNAATTRRDGQNKSPSKERLLSPSKIPLKNKANGSLNTARFISMPEQNAGKIERFAKEDTNDKQAGQSVQNGQSESGAKENGINGNSSGNADEVDLIDLLKQTSQTTGTSSERLVNTTTTTAVQPLHIDANTLLVERNDGSTTNQQKDRPDGTLKTSPASKSESPLSTSNASMGQKSSPFVENQPVRTGQGISPGNDKKDSLVVAENSTGGHSKSGSVGQSVKSVRISEESLVHQRSSNQSSANQRSGKNSQNARGSKPGDGKEEPEAASMASAEVKGGSAGSKMTASRDVLANDKMPTVMENDSKVRTAEEATTNNATAMTANSVARSNSVSPAIGAVNAGVNSDAVVRTRNENRGSDASLKSSTGVSTDSIESVRSTDTGVSVNTVRGVSSPREKTGVHTVKRPQEIETLSGNIVRVEQNGEPA